MTDRQAPRRVVQADNPTTARRFVFDRGAAKGIVWLLAGLLLAELSQLGTSEPVKCVESGAVSERSSPQTALLPDGLYFDFGALFSRNKARRRLAGQMPFQLLHD
jgi:hypothetical protein